MAFQEKNKKKAGDNKLVHCSYMADARYIFHGKNASNLPVYGIGRVTRYRISPDTCLALDAKVLGEIPSIF